MRRILWEIKENYTRRIGSIQFRKLFGQAQRVYLTSNATMGWTYKQDELKRTLDTKIHGKETS